MKIDKPYDLFVATINNPNATTYDLMSNNMNPENTSLYSKEEYKSSKYIQDSFKTEDGKFDDLAFDNFYKTASNHYNLMTNEKYLEDINQIEYSPFDVTRPFQSKTANIEVSFSKDFNPFKQLYGRTEIYSTDDSDLSIRELAQQEKIYDYTNDKWLDYSANTSNIVNKFLGDTLVYAQWDEDGTHKDIKTGNIVNHKKGDWKVNESGNLFIETLGNREVYGKQIVNPLDLLTTDGSLANKFDFFDSDSKEKSVIGTTVKIAAEIAPFLIPGVNTYYAGIKTAIGLSSVLPTFYKSLEGILLGDDVSKLYNVASAAEGYMSKFTTSSTSDEAQGSFLNYEQMSQMVSDVFSQIYEQRAMASLSNIISKSQINKLNAKQTELINKINNSVFKDLQNKKITLDQVETIRNAAISKIPELKSLEKLQSGLSKSLSLGYMALTSTADIYGEALESGYDKRTAGFASLLAASGQYGIMMNNRMGDWFLDKTTGYNVNVNKALIKKSTKEYLDPIKKAFESKSKVEQKVKLASTFKSFKNKIQDLFTNPSVIGESLIKHSVIEGVEEVSEELVLDASKAIIDTMSYLGLTKKKGSFNAIDNMFSHEGFERYLASLVGGVIGGSMFELHRTKLEPWISGNPLSEPTKKSIYELVANGETQSIIDEINKQRSRLGNNYIAPVVIEGEVTPTENKIKSQSDVIADTAIQMVKNIESIMVNNDLIKTDDEIINNAMLNSLIIKDLEASKSENYTVGIEGIILDDYKNTSSKLIEINSEIASLSTNSKDIEKNKEVISKLQKEANTYKQKIESIIEGKNSDKYFDEILFYLSKNISEAYLTIDRDTFIRNKYNEDYYKLPDSGIGLTKERIDKEWKEFLDSSDVRKNIEISTKAYKEIEKQINPSISTYTESTYNQQREKTFTNLFNIIKNIELFNTLDENSKVNNINNFIKIVQDIESETGKRIIPWDSIKIDVADNIINSKLLERKIIDSENNLISEKVSNEYLNEVVYKDENNKSITRKDIIKKLLDDTTSSLPSENLSLDMIADHFNNVSLKNYNLLIDNKIFQIKTTNSGWETNSEVLNQIENLNKQKIEFEIQKYEDTDDYKERKLKNDTDLNVKLEELELTPEILGLHEYLISKKIDPNTFETFTDYYDSEINTDEIRNNILNSNIFKSFEIFGDKNIIESVKTGISFDLNTIIDHLLDFKNISIIILDPEHDSNVNKNITDYLNYKNKLEKNLLDKSKILDIYKIQNYALNAIISEIESGNLDKELVNKLNESLTNILKDIKINYLNNLNISDSNLLNLILNIDNIFSNLIEIYESGLQEVQMGVSEDINEYIENDSIPKYLQNVVSDNYDFNMLISDISKLNEFLNLDSSKILKENINKINNININSNKFISNSIYDFLKNFNVSLNDKKSRRVNNIFDILKKEELSLLNASNISNYFSESINDSDLQQAINVIKLLQSAVLAMQTTTIDFDDKYGFIYSRQKFLKENNIKSDVLDLKTIDSDSAALMNLDLERLKVKLQFLKDLGKFNSSRMFNEQETIRNQMTSILINEWKKLSDKELKFKGTVVIPDLSEIINSAYSEEKKLIEIESLIYESNKDLTNDDKLELIDLLLSDYNFKNQVENLGEIDKDVKSISNMDFVYYFASILSVYSKDFNNKLLTLLKSTFDKAPFYTQELAVKIAYGSVANSYLFEELNKKYKHNETHLTDSITYLLGGGGTGKTTVLFKLIVELLKENNPNLSIWFSAPHIDQTKKLKNDVLNNVDSDNFTISEFNKNQLFDQLGIKELIDSIKSDVLSKTFSFTKEEEGGFINIDFENENAPKLGELSDQLPNLLFIDEVTHFDAIELEVLNRISKFGKIKIFAAGDTSQRGALFNKISYNVDRVSGTFSPILNLTVRAANVQKRSNNDGLVGTIKFINKNYETEKDKEKVLSHVIGNTMLRYYRDKEILTGDLLTTSLTSDLINIIKNQLFLDPNKTLGLLVKDENEYKVKLQNEGLDLSKIKFFTTDNIQGSETDFFIFETSVINTDVISHKLKAFYTYMSRAKTASIIIDSGNISEFGIIPKEDEVTEIIDPLTPEIIKETKETRIKKLTEILDPNFDIIHDKWKLDSELIITNDEEIIDTVLDDSFEQPSSEEANEELKGEPEKGSDKDIIFTPEKEFSYMFHTFYNNLNVKYEKVNNKVILTSNPSKDLTDLNIIVSELGKKEITEDEFNILTSGLINTKYYFLNKLKDNPKLFNSGKEKSIFTNEMLNNEFLKQIFGENYKTNNYKLDLVLHSSNYSEEYNKPFEKFNDDLTKHLTNNSKFINLSAKITNENGKIIYISLANITTLESASLPNALKNHPESLEKLKEIYDNHKDDTIVNPNTVLVLTSTRLEKQKEKIKKPLSLNNLKKVKGLKVSDVKLFPTNKEDFYKVYNKVNFGKEISKEKLDLLFPKYKGRPYVEIYFLSDDSQKQLVLLKSKRRSLKGKGNIQEEALKLSKRLMNNKLTDTERNKIRKETTTFVSGNQALDLLIKLATQKPDLFDKLFKSNFDVPSELTKYLPNFVSKNIIDYITWTKNSELSSFKNILFSIQKEIKNNPKISPKDLKSKVLPLAKSEPIWYGKFWNIFKLNEELKEGINKAKNGDGISDFIEKGYNEIINTMEAILTFWKDEPFYYNIPIEPLEKGSATSLNKYKPSQIDLNDEYLYTDLLPEGPRIAINLKNWQSPIIEPLDNELIKLKNKLNTLTYNGISIFESESNDKLILNDQINRAEKIIEILKNNPSLDINNLKTSTLNELENLIKSFTKINPTIDELNEYFSNLSQDNYLSENVLNNIKMFMDNHPDKELVNKTWTNLYNTLFKYIIDNKLNPSSTELIKLMNEKLNIVVEANGISINEMMVYVDSDGQTSYDIETYGDIYLNEFLKNIFNTDEDIIC